MPEKRAMEKKRRSSSSNTTYQQQQQQQQSFSKVTFPLVSLRGCIHCRNVNHTHFTYMYWKTKRANTLCSGSPSKQAYLFIFRWSPFRLTPIACDSFFFAILLHLLQWATLLYVKFGCCCGCYCFRCWRNIHIRIHKMSNWNEKFLFSFYLLLLLLLRLFFLFLHIRFARCLLSSIVLIVFFLCMATTQVQITNLKALKSSVAHSWCKASMNIVECFGVKKKRFSCHLLKSSFWCLLPSFSLILGLCINLYEFRLETNLHLWFHFQTPFFSFVCIVKYCVIIPESFYFWKESVPTTSNGGGGGAGGERKTHKCR